MKALYLPLMLALSACVNHPDPKPITMKQSNDAEMDCKALAVEYKSNTEAATYKISKNKSDDGQDVLLGAFIWPGLADFKNADGVEGNALLDRNAYLKEMAQTKECDVTDYPTQPSRYN